MICYLTDGWSWTLFLFFVVACYLWNPHLKFWNYFNRKKSNRKVSNLAHSNGNNIIDNSGYVKENNLERLSKFSSTSIIVVTLWQILLNTILQLSSTCFLVREFLIWMEILCNRNSMNLVQRHKKIGKDPSLLQFLQFRFSNNCKGDIQSQGG